MTGAIERFTTLISRGRPTLSELEDVVNVDNEDINANIRAIVADSDMSNALFDLIDTMAAESNSYMSAGRKDHADMLFHHGGYARLQDLKMELQRLAGLTES